MHSTIIITVVCHEHCDTLGHIDYVISEHEPTTSRSGVQRSSLVSVDWPTTVKVCAPITGKIIGIITVRST